MRIPHRKQQYLGCTPVTQVVLNPNCRDRMIPILRGLQHLYSRPRLRQKALDLIAQDVLQDADPNQGRPGLTWWQILVLAAVRLGCDFTYDHLQDLAENHNNLRNIMQIFGDWEEESFDFRRIRDNVCRVRPETIEDINHLIVAEGHRLEPSAAETVRGDSFVAETNIHYPTESSLILDGLKKILLLAPALASLIEVSGWRQHKSLSKKAKKAGREIGRINKDGDYQARLQTSYGKLLDIAELVLSRTQELLDEALQNGPIADTQSLSREAASLAGEVVFLREELTYWHATTTQVCSTAWRRVMQGEGVPNSDKLFSLFEPDSELIKRGKASQPIQYGHKVLVIEDALGFICHYKVVPLATDDREILIPEFKQLRQRLRGRIQRASFDRGFHSQDNQTELAKLVAHPCIPKLGVKQAAEQEAQASVEFRQAKQKHSGIESAIGALQSGNALARCRDRSQVGYARYIGLGILGRNLLMLGKLLLSREQPDSLAASSLRDAA
jgi:IS5 family transposase